MWRLGASLLRISSETICNIGRRQQIYQYYGPACAYELCGTADFRLRTTCCFMSFRPHYSVNLYLTHAAIYFDAAGRTVLRRRIGQYQRLRSADGLVVGALNTLSPDLLTQLRAL